MSRSRKIVLRPEVVWFAEQMEKALRRNDYKGHWCDEDESYLREKLEEEVAELERACERRNKAPKKIREAADIANIVMMIADNSRRYETGADL